MKASRPSVPFLLCLGFIVSMLPFLNKAAHIDDPLFLWGAEQILRNPLDFYGFCVNWYGWDMPMWEVMKNPPLTSYYLALLMAIGGRSEIWLHIGMLLPGVLAVLGTHKLADRLCDNGWLATVLTVASVPFFLAAGGFMAEATLLALWVWSVYCFILGEQEDSPGMLVVGSVLAGLAILAKYNALALVPLLFAYSVLWNRTIRPRVLFLLIPVAIALLYQGATAMIYGEGLLTSAMDYSLRFTNLAQGGLGAMADITLTGFAFLGGSLLACGLLAPAAWGKRSLWLVALAAAVAILVAMGGGIANVDFVAMGGSGWFAIAQAGLFAAAGFFVIALSVAETIRGRDADTLLLALWICGQFIFAAYINWSINGRSILPLVPAAAILVVRSVELRADSADSNGHGIRAAWIAPAAIAGVLTLALARCDMQWANAGRAFAQSLAGHLEENAQSFSGRVYFAGHWGFQFAMENQGYTPLDHKCSTLKQGDLLVLPLGMLQKPIPLEYFEKTDQITYPSCGWLATHHEKRLSGFYSNVFGPLPYVIAPTGPHRFSLYTAQTDLNFSPCVPCLALEPGPERGRSAQ